MSPDMEGDEAESPMPHPAQMSQTGRRRGAISAEPITEEDVATYVKKVGSSGQLSLVRLEDHLLWFF